MKILIIDDLPHMRNILAFNLKRLGLEVICASNGLDGIKMAQEEKPDLIFLDVMMPRMDGFETCQKMRRDDALRLVPIIMLTAKAEKESVIQAIKEGASDYIIKPYKLTDILEKLEKHLKIKVEKEPGSDSPPAEN